MPAFKIEIGIPDECAFDLFGRKRIEIVEDGFAAVDSRRGGEARVENLGRLRIADREFTGPLDVSAGRVAGCTNEAELVLPAHRRDHVLGRHVECAVRIHGADENEGRHGKESFPDRLARVDFDQAAVCA